MTAFLRRLFLPAPEINLAKEKAETFMRRAEVVEIKPDDVLVFTCSTNISQEVAEHIKQIAEERFPDNTAIVLAGGVTVEVLRPGAGRNELAPAVEPSKAGEQNG